MKFVNKEFLTRFKLERTVVVSLAIAGFIILMTILFAVYKIDQVTSKYNTEKDVLKKENANLRSTLEKLSKDNKKLMEDCKYQKEWLKTASETAKESGVMMPPPPVVENNNAK